MYVDLTWVQDYGAFVAATIAALAAITNGLLAAKRDRAFKTGEWMRETRLPRYVAFLRSADDFKQAIFWNYAEADYEITGPPPKKTPDHDAVGREFRHQLSEVSLVGPADVVSASKYVQYSLWHYTGQLEHDPGDFNQSHVAKAVNDFIEEARLAIGIDLSLDQTWDYRVWRDSLTSEDP